MASHAPQYDSIYSDSDYRLKYHDAGGDKLLITFTPRYGRDADDRTGFGAGVFEKYGWSMLCVVAKWDHWWQPSGIEEIVRISNNIITVRNYRQIVTYGMSMGGFGAGLLADRLGAKRAVMVAPQFSIDPHTPPYERRWIKEAAKIEFMNNDMDAALKGAAHRIIISDPWHPLDRVHTDLFKGYQTCQFVSVPFGGHSPADVLKEAKMLRKTIIELLDSSFDPKQFRLLLRKNRSLSPSYLAMMSDKIWRRHPSAAIFLLDKAIEMVPTRPTFMCRKVGLQVRMKDWPAALETSKVGLKLFPNQHSLWKSYSEALTAVGEHDEAISAAISAQEARPLGSGLIASR